MRVPLRRTLNAMNRRGGEATKALMTGRQVRIWSDQWRAWWRPNGQGYTDDVEQAGVESFEAAYGRTYHCGPEKKIVYEEVLTIVSESERPYLRVVK